MIITPRLLKIARLIPQGSRIADIGTDHGFLPIYLLENNLIDFAVCSDVKKGPLDNARKNIKKYGFENKTRLCLADGLAGVLPNEADTAVIAGMGGEMIATILENGIPEGMNRFFLQPMRNIDVLRKKIHQLGIKIIDELLVNEKDKFYIIICAEKGNETTWSEDDYIVSPLLKKELLWPEYSAKERAKILRAKAELEKSENKEKQKEFERLLKLYE